MVTGARTERAVSGLQQEATWGSSVATSPNACSRPGAAHDNHHRGQVATANVSSGISFCYRPTLTAPCFQAFVCAARRREKHQTRAGSLARGHGKRACLTANSPQTSTPQRRRTLLSPLCRPPSSVRCSLGDFESGVCVWCASQCVCPVSADRESPFSDRNVANFFQSTCDDSCCK